MTAHDVRSNGAAVTPDEQDLWNLAKRARGQLDGMLDMISERRLPVPDQALDALERAVEVLGQHVIGVELPGSGDRFRM